MSGAEGRGRGVHVHSCIWSWSTGRSCQRSMEPQTLLYFSEEQDRVVSKLSSPPMWPWG